MTPQEQVIRGNHARQMLADPLFKEAWSSYETVLLNLLANPDTLPDKAVEVRGWLIAARKARQHLERIVTDGVLAADQIKQEERRKTVPQRVRAAFR